MSLAQGIKDLEKKMGLVVEEVPLEVGRGSQMDLEVGRANLVEEVLEEREEVLEVETDQIVLEVVEGLAPVTQTLAVLEVEMEDLDRKGVEVALEALVDLEVPVEVDLVEINHKGIYFISYSEVIKSHLVYVSVCFL